MIDGDELRASHFKELERSLQALASAASDQLALFPEFAANANELASNFAHWSTVVREHYGSELTRDQSGALTAIDQKLATISRDGSEFDPGLWTDAALSSSAHWEDVRQLANNAIGQFESSKVPGGVA